MKSLLMCMHAFLCPTQETQPEFEIPADTQMEDATWQETQPDVSSTHAEAGSFWLDSL